MSRWYSCVYCTHDLHCTKYAEPGYESWCVLGPCTAETPSNADRIRAMTDEELAEFMKPYDSGCPRWGGKEPIPCSQRSNCRDCWLDWLKAPVEVDK